MCTSDPPSCGSCITLSIKSTAVFFEVTVKVTAFNMYLTLHYIIHLAHFVCSRYSCMGCRLHRFVLGLFFGIDKKNKTSRERKRKVMNVCWKTETFNDCLNTCCSLWRFPGEDSNCHLDDLMFWQTIVFAHWIVDCKGGMNVKQGLNKHDWAYFSVLFLCVYPCHYTHLLNTIQWWGKVLWFLT